MHLPSNAQEWEEVATEFFEKWNFPNCIGAVGGKHVTIKWPSNSHSLCFNYKCNYSTVLMAIVNASYKFIYINVGQPGGNGDGGVFSMCSFEKWLRRNKLNLPDDIPIPNQASPVSYYIIVDDAFPLL